MKKIICLITMMLIFTLSACSTAPSSLKEFLKTITSDELNFTMTTTSTINKDIIKVNGNIVYVDNQIIGDAISTKSYYVSDSSTTYRYYELLGKWTKTQVLNNGITIQKDWEDFEVDDFTANDDGSYTLSDTLKVIAHGSMKITFEHNIVTVKKTFETIEFTNFNTTKITLPEIE